MQKQDVLFTGERIIPELENYFFSEHIARYRFFKDAVNARDCLLDVGCGDGYGTYFLSAFVKKAIGIDVSQETILKAQKKYQSNNLQYLWVGPDRWTFQDESFDAIAFFEVFEHVSNPENLLREANRVLKPRGRFLISTPNKDVFGEKLPVPFHVKEYSLNEFTQIVEKYFRIQKVIGQRNAHKYSRWINFKLAKFAMKYPWLLEPYSWYLSKKSRPHFSIDYFESNKFRGPLFSEVEPETADYFLLLATKQI